GMIILRDGDPGEPEVLLSPPEYVYEHRADADVVVDAGTPALRDALFDSIMVAIGNAVSADRTFGGLCDYAETAAPVPVDLIVEGAPGFKAATLPIILHYGTSDPLS
ncbi:MAG: acyl-CoA transferase, partial [Alphaproteobacteria bacterium]|nr:acyl-CoA transferase [Alphaproteobacteria bacterium]